MARYDSLGDELISIYSPHARGDSNVTTSPFDAGTFQSTPLMRGETLMAAQYR